MHKEDANWLYLTEDYEGMYRASAGREKAFLIGDGSTFPHIHWRSERIWDILKHRRGLCPKIAGRRYFRGLRLFDREGRIEAEVWERSAAVGGALRYVTYLYVKPVSGALTNNALCTEPTDWEKLVMHKFQGPTLPRLLQFLPDSVTAALEIIKLETSIGAVLELYEQRQVV